MAPRKHSIQQQHLLQPREDKTDLHSSVHRTEVISNTTYDNKSKGKVDKMIQSDFIGILDWVKKGYMKFKALPKPSWPYYV
jgi:hypothetical protein